VSFLDDVARATFNKFDASERKKLIKTVKSKSKAFAADAVCDVVQSEIGLPRPICKRISNRIVRFIK